MSVRQELLTALQKALPTKAGFVVVHSSLHQLSPPASLNNFDILYPFKTLADQGWTFAFPAFTFSFCRGIPFHFRESKSETGILAQLILDSFSDARRSPHPIYSFALLGPDQAKIFNCPSITTFGDDSPFGLFESENATMVMLGCGWEYCTLFHRFEEVARVPYRYEKEFAGEADYGRGKARVTAKMLVRDLKIDAHNDFRPAYEELRNKGFVKNESLWQGQIQSAQSRDIAQICRQQLGNNPLAYISNTEAVKKKLAYRNESFAQPPLKLAVLGSSNLKLLEDSWLDQATKLIPERRIEAFHLPFGQLRQQMLDSNSDLRKFKPNISVFCDRLEDLASFSGRDRAKILEEVRVSVRGIALFHEQMGGSTIVHRFASLAPSLAEDRRSEESSLLTEANSILDELLGDLAQLVFVDLAAESAAHNGEVVDPRTWLIGRFPFSASFSERLARRWMGITLNAVGKSSRLVVVDLDHTLWGGVLGEEGLEGIKIGGDFPGNAFSRFQLALRDIRSRGIALAISSKNDEDLALQALNTLPEMILRPDDFSAKRINWRPKSQNIQEIADELNLGIDSVLFIDDNPVERENVRCGLPGIKVLDLPPDPALYVEALRLCPFLMGGKATKEDRGRLNNFESRKEREKQMVSATSIEDYFKSLEMKLHLNPLEAGNSQRAAQLCQKTNQFNSTTKRYDLADLKQLAEEGADVVVLGLEDKLAPLENIGLIVLKSENGIGHIDLYLLSCRVLGRGIETAVPKWATERAAARGWPRLRARIIETERNTPVRNVFRDAGFQEVEKGIWEMTTAIKQPLPDWLALNDQVGGQAR